MLDKEQELNELQKEFEKQEQELHNCSVAYASNVESIEKALNVLFSSFTTMGVKTIVDDMHYTTCTHETYEGFYCVAVLYLLDNKGKEIFGTRISLKIYSDYVSINYGTMGDHNSKEDKDIIAHDILIGKIWEHEQEIINAVFNNFNENICAVFKKQYRIAIQAQNDYNKANNAYEKEKALNELKKAKYIIIRNDLHYKIVKITPKRIYVKRLIQERTWNGDELVFTNNYTISHETIIKLDDIICYMVHDEDSIEVLEELPSYMKII